MYILLKGALVAIGSVSAFWVGQELFSQPATPEYPAQTTVTAEFYHSEKALQTLQQAVATLSTRLAGIEAAQRDLAALNIRLAQLEEAQRSLSQDLDVAMPLQPDAVVAEVQQTFAYEADGEGASLALWEEQAAEATWAQDAVERFSTVFWEEAYDPAWGIQTETYIQHAWDGLDLQESQLLATACHSTMCRIEIGHDSEEAREQFMLNLALMMPFAIEAVSHPLIQGEQSSGTVVYLARAD